MNQIREWLARRLLSLWEWVQPVLEPPDKETPRAQAALDAWKKNPGWEPPKAGSLPAGYSGLCHYAYLQDERCTLRKGHEGEHAHPNYRTDMGSGKRSSRATRTGRLT